MITEKQHREMEETKAIAQESYAQPDDLIDFYHLKSRKVREKVGICEGNPWQIVEDCRAVWRMLLEVLHCPESTKFSLQLS